MPRTMNEYKCLVDACNDACKSILVSREAMNQIKMISQNFYRSMEVINPTWISLTKQFQSEFSKAAILSVSDSIIKQQERMKEIFASSAMTESIRQMQIAMENTDQITKAASSALAALSSVEIPAVKTLISENITSAFSNLEIPKFSSALIDSLQEMSKETTLSVESLTKSIADHYEVETKQEKETIAEIKKASKTKKLSFGDIIALITLIITVYQAALSTYSQFLVKSAQQNRINIVQYVNNFYISNEEMAQDYNGFGLRIINKQTFARVKPDCSSKVEGKLSAGTIVSVTSKYKKWIEVFWFGEDENLHFGWIQNYKASEFKKY